jgi:hypothetical protein
MPRMCNVPKNSAKIYWQMLESSMKSSRLEALPNEDMAIELQALDMAARVDMEIDSLQTGPTRMVGMLAIATPLLHQHQEAVP